ncbi:peptidoglycan recognition protein S3 [Lasioglossum baleicum]|uniref:peptidoglycan recognition protein S3 n=1 Tax=Lasioglossum baleicum TaxID=434251 RepID=UPI003FCD5F8E
MVNKIWTIIFLVLHTYTANADDESPPIIKRTEWSSAPPKSINYLILPLPYVIIAHTAGPQCSTRSQCSSIVEGIRSYHMDTLGWHDIGFSFLIGGDGNVYEGAGWNREGAHTIGYNKRSIGIAFIGNFQDTSASEKMLNAAHKLIVWGKSQEILRDDVRVIGARQAVNIISPGNKVYEQIQNWPEWVSTP